MVSERVGEYIQAKGISFYAFENSLGASRGSISKAVKDGKSIGSNMLEKIMQTYPDINPAWLLTGDGDMTLKEGDNKSLRTYRLKTDTPLENQLVPLYNIEAVAGIVPLFDSANSIKASDNIFIPNLPKCDGAVHVTGDSMYPLLNSGDIVLYKIVEDIANNIFWGEMYLLGISIAGDEYITVKFIHRSDQDGWVKLVSKNPSHQDKEIRLENIKALAIIKASIRINAMV